MDLLVLRRAFLQNFSTHCQLESTPVTPSGSIFEYILKINDIHSLSAAILGLMLLTSRRVVSGIMPGKNWLGSLSHRRAWLGGWR